MADSEAATLSHHRCDNTKGIADSDHLVDVEISPHPIFRVGVSSPTGLTWSQFVCLAIVTVLAGIFLVILSAFGTDNHRETQFLSPGLSLAYSFDIGKPLRLFNHTDGEPSGLAHRSSTGTLFVVVDHEMSGKVAEFSAKGKLLSVFEIGGQDMEGIAWNPRKDQFLIAEEQSRRVIVFDPNFIRVGMPQAISTVDRPVLNSELEGITVAGDDGHIWIANEKNPPMLIELDPEFKELRRFDLSKYFLDVSGISYDAISGCLWICSDQSKSLALISRVDSSIVCSFSLNLNKYEGIAAFGEYVALVNDNTKSVSVYNRPACPEALPVKCQ